MLVPNVEIFREIVIKPHSSDWINKLGVYDLKTHAGNSGFPLLS